MALVRVLLFLFAGLPACLPRKESWEYTVVKSFLLWVSLLLLSAAVRPVAAQQLKADAVERTSVQVTVKKQHQVYRGNAVLVLKDCTLRADRLDVYSTDATQEKVLATGHVQLVVTKTSPLKSFTLKAQKADYEAAKNEVHLTGDVRFTRGEAGFVQGIGKAVIGQALTAAARTVTYRSTEKTIGTTLEYTLADPSAAGFWPIDEDRSLAERISDVEKQEQVAAVKTARKRR